MRPLLVVLACAAAPGFSARLLGAQTSQTAAAPSTRAVRAQIEIGQATYRVEDTVAVRLTLTNTGAVPLEVIAVPPWRAVRLIVTGSDGRPIEPADDPDDRSYHSGRLPPGRYTPTAVPLVSGYDMQVDTVTVRSNQVTITVAP